MSVLNKSLRRSSFVQIVVVAFLAYLMGVMTPQMVANKAPHAPAATTETSVQVNHSNLASIGGDVLVIGKQTVGALERKLEEEEIEEETEEEEGEEGEEEEEEEEEEGEGFDLTSDEDVTIVVSIVLILIFLTIAFEYVKDEMEERASNNLRPIVDKLFGELTVLGFLSMFTFVVTKAGYFRILSEIFFGDEEELLEIFEFVHFTIFFVMVFFVVQVLILVSEAMDTEEEWMGMEKMARDPNLNAEWERRSKEYVKDVVARSTQRFHALRVFVRLMPFLRAKKEQQKHDLVMFKALRDEFILERNNVPPFSPGDPDKRVSPDFNFGRYLSICLGSFLSQVVEVSILTWLIFAGLTCIYYFYVIFVNESVAILAWSWVVMGWVVFFYNIYFEQHLISVRDQFLRCDLFDKVGNGTPTEQTHLNSTNNDLPLWTKIHVEGYHRNKSWFEKWLSPGVPTKPQAIYWLDKKGPKFYLLILQSNLLFLGIFSSMNVLGFLQFMWQNESWLVFTAYFVLSMLPLLGVMFDKQHLAAVLSQNLCMGAFRRPSVVADVLREEKTAHVVRAFIVIYKMRRFAMSSSSSKYNKEEAKERRKNFDKVELAEVGKTFDAFDTSGDGNISYEEFEALMNNLGAEMTEASLNNMISLLDADGDGEVSKDEFIDWYAENAGDDDLTEGERALYLFRLFDTEDTGELTIGQFKRKLDSLNVGFSVDEVGAIVNELDEDNSGSIGLEEFSVLLAKYYPKELKTQDTGGSKGPFAKFFKEHHHSSLHHSHDELDHSEEGHHH